MSIDYKYTVEVVDTTNSRIRVKYTSVGRADVRKNLKCSDFTAAAVDELINLNCPVRLWDREENPPAVEIVEGTELATAYRPPVEPPAYVPTPKEVFEADMKAIADDRYRREASGVSWTDAAGNEYFFDTSVNSQNRHTASQASITKGSRREGGIWKCFAVDDVGEVTLTYLPLSSAELSAVNDVVKDHVEKCFDAEANTFARYAAGDTSATFEEEWAKLR